MRRSGLIFVGTVDNRSFAYSIMDGSTGQWKQDARDLLTSVKIDTNVGGGEVWNKSIVDVGNDGAGADNHSGMTAIASISMGQSGSTRAEMPTRVLTGGVLGRDVAAADFTDEGDVFGAEAHDVQIRLHDIAKRRSGRRQRQ